jgi:hypothetical protein
MILFESANKAYFDVIIYSSDLLISRSHYTSSTTSRILILRSLDLVTELLLCVNNFGIGDFVCSSLKALYDIERAGPDTNYVISTLMLARRKQRFMNKNPSVYTVSRLATFSALLDYK